jgi:hypothetical protein
MSEREDCVLQTRRTGVKSGASPPGCSGGGRAEPFRPLARKDVTRFRKTPLLLRTGGIVLLKKILDFARFVM